MIEITNDNYLKTLKFIEERSIKINNLDLLLIFTVGDVTFEYVPRDSYLHNLHGSNGRIFTELNLNKYKFCESVYGHKPHQGDFPECVFNANECLIKIIRALFDECCNSVAPIEKLSITSIKTSFVDKIKEVPPISPIVEINDILF